MEGFVIFMNRHYCLIDKDKNPVTEENIRQEKLFNSIQEKIWTDEAIYFASPFLLLNIPLNYHTGILSAKSK